MRLTADEFAEIVRSLNLEPREDGDADKRRAPRVGQRGPIEITICVNEDAEGFVLDSTQNVRMTVEFANISSRGIALTLAEPMTPGQQFVAHLPRLGGKMVNILCTIVHCHRKMGTLFSAGAEFTCALTEGAMEWRSEEKQLKRIRKSVLS